MRRRPLLAALGAGTLTLAGCQSIADGNEETPTATSTDTPQGPDGRRYEECTREIIPYDQFPADVRAEIDAALEDSYEADRVYLGEAMDVDRSYVSVDDTYYDPSVTVEADTERLELEAVEPKAVPRPRPISVEHDRDGERTITVEMTAGETVLLEETRTLRVGPVEFGRVRRVGTHDLHVTVADGDEVEDEFTGSIRIDQSHFDVIVVIEEELSVTGAVADLVVCRYDDEDQK